jgi:hypothetical protein
MNIKNKVKSLFHKRNNIAFIIVTDHFLIIYHEYKQRGTGITSASHYSYACRHRGCFSFPCFFPVHR